MLLIIGSLLLGCLFLLLGADWLVGGASKIAKTFGIPKSVVGLTLVAIGTSAPELFVNSLAALRGNTDFALANVSGSNLANVCIGLSLCALVANISIQRSEFGYDLMLFIAAPLIIMVLFVLSPDQLPYLSVIPFVLCLLIYMFSLTKRSLNDNDEADDSQGKFAGVLPFVLGVAGLYVGGELLLHGATKVSHLLGLSDAVIGLTVIALGTSIPDVTASVIASLKGENSIAVGNILGSNISNIIVVLNSTILISGGPLPANPAIVMDFSFVFLTSFVLVTAAMLTQKIPKWTGAILLLSYLGYIGFRVASEM